MAKSDPLERYNAKRDFQRTAEPAGKRARSTGGNSFCVQKHDATRLHWDFRLEVDGVLKSWAVTRGPSPDPDDKRLAVRTEDHPLAYGDFEGTIPAGEYGGGTVMLWDRGTWEPVPGKSAADLDKGHLHFVLHGERMRGEWLLIRLKPRGKEKRENWLLRKIDDDHATAGDVLVERALTSVKTGRTMQDIAAGRSGGRKPAPKAKRARAAGPPAFRPVQLATLVDHVPAGADWLHETKYDGYRALLAVGGGKAKVFTRSGLDWSGKFPRLAEAAAALPVDSALIDGEIVVFDGHGRPDFSALQAAIKSGDPDALFFAFDLLEHDGADTAPLGNLERKELLRPLIPATGPIRFAEHVVGSGEPLFRAMCAHGLEGIVSKRAAAPYLGKRAQGWLKVKCVNRAEFVILGWTTSTNRQRGFGALLMGVHENGALRYVGKVGTGFDAATLDALRREMAPLAADEPAAEVPRAARRGAHWLRPELVAEVAYGDLTADGILRHASYVGLRRDKPAGDVQMERPQPAPDAASDDAPVSGPDAGQVHISSRDRVIFPESGVTKGQLADYYAAMAPLVLPALAGRPISLIRCPQGRAKQCFFQKHGAENLGDAIRTVKVRGKDGTAHDYFYVEDATGLLECVQMGTIEFHGWGSHVATLEKPDRLVFDLDPDEGIDFGTVKKAARDLRTHLADIGLVSFAMLSGGKGIHVVVPVLPERTWPEVSDFAHRFAQALATAEPERFVATMAKARRKGRIFIDWLRNQRGSTAVMPYVVRARPGAPVAAPVSWDELDGIESPARFSLADVEELRRRAAGKVLAGWGVSVQHLPDV